ncbi:MAG: hypothetical protein SVO01_00400 [Thermotogota bacterium]|nr:hypothetical protein [Thermotogota bacterium]
MKAYILSQQHGTVQIGCTVYQPCTNSSFRADRKGLRGLPVVEVGTQSMSEAIKALQMFQRRKKNGKDNLCN